ncbi:MAG: winged helix-turn-helix transcriptional regulator [Candidatus Heimdallarchaeaceae archaeon]
MERLPFLEVKILHALQESPLDSYENIAKKLKIPLSTLYRKIKSLEKRNIIKHILSSKIAEKIGLTRYTIEFKISSLEQMQLMQLAFNEHPYTYHYNRFYGNEYGFYVKFDVPEEGFTLFEDFLKELINREFCEGYNLYASTGNWIDIHEPVPNYRLNPKNFNLVEFWGKRSMMSVNDFEPYEKINLTKLHPIQFLILRDINKEMRRTQKSILKEYKKLINLPVEEDQDRIIPPAYRPYISEFFSGRSEEAILMDFNRKFSFVADNLITNVRLNFSRRFFEQYPMQAYVIRDVSKKESNQIISLFRKYKPPFRAGIDLLNRGLFITTTLPPYYAARFSYLILSSFSDFKFYNLDFFGEHGVAYPFFVENFDPDKRCWRIDREWMIDAVFDRINEKLNNGKYGEIKNGH